MKVLPWNLRVGLRAAREASRVLRCACNDGWRYLKHSATVDPYRTKGSFRALLQKRQHIVEKGLSLPAPRPGFGEENVRCLLSEIAEYTRRFGRDPLVQNCVGALAAYRKFNEDNGTALPHLAEMLVTSQASCLDDQPQGGIELMHRDDVVRAAKRDFESLSRSRKSVRNFLPEPVPDCEIAAAVSVAQFTPSVCNRQAWKVHLFRGAEGCRPLLAIQTGNRGFTECIQNLVIVTCRLDAFMSVGERHQSYVDGGMFAMSLIYAFQSRGVGTCPLNLSLDIDEADRLRVAGSIPDGEDLIMAIALGYMPDIFAVAQSKRAPIEEVLVPHLT